MVQVTETGLINSMSGNFSPKTSATRVQLVTPLMRLTDETA